MKIPYYCTCMSIARCCVRTSLSESCGQSTVRTKSVDEAPWSVIIYHIRFCQHVQSISDKINQLTLIEIGSTVYVCHSSQQTSNRILPNSGRTQCIDHLQYQFHSDNSPTASPIDIDNHIQGIDWSIAMEKLKSSIKRTPDKCWIQWVGNLHPKVNHGIWTKDDLEKLHHLTGKLTGCSTRPSATIHDRAPGSPLGLDGKGRRGGSRERTKNGGFGASKKGTSLFEVKKWEFVHL